MYSLDVIEMIPLLESVPSLRRDVQAGLHDLRRCGGQVTRLAQAGLPDRAADLALSKLPPRGEAASSPEPHSPSSPLHHAIRTVSRTTVWISNPAPELTSRPLDLCQLPLVSPHPQSQSPSGLHRLLDPSHRLDTFFVCPDASLADRPTIWRLPSPARPT